MNLRRLVLVCALVGLPGCYLAHGLEAESSRFGVFTFASCTGSGAFLMLAICPDGSLRCRLGTLRDDGDVGTGHWDVLDGEGDRIEVITLLRARLVLRWNGAAGTWIWEAPIDSCSETALGYEALTYGFRELADAMPCR